MNRTDTEWQRLLNAKEAQIQIVYTQRNELAKVLEQIQDVCKPRINSRASLALINSKIKPALEQWLK